MTNESDLKMEANGGSLARPRCCSSVTAPLGDAPSSRLAGRAKSLAAPASLIFDMASWLKGDNLLAKGVAVGGGYWRIKAATVAYNFFKKGIESRKSGKFLPVGDELRRVPECVTANSPEYAALEGLKHRDSPQYVTKKIWYGKRRGNFAGHERGGRRNC